MSLADEAKEREEYHQKVRLEKLREKLEQNRIIDKDTGCWHWMKHVANTGYGQIYDAMTGKLFSTHRIAMVIYSGFVESDDRLKLVCHKCPIRNCFNPDHLYVGTASDNMYDKSAAGNSKYNRGERSGRTHLTEKDVVEIRRLFAKGDLQKDLAIQFGVADRTICAIVRRTSWKHLT